MAAAVSEPPAEVPAPEYEPVKVAHTPPGSPGLEDAELTDVSSGEAQAAAEFISDESNVIEPEGSAPADESSATA